jgi:hypothetical protein
MDDFSVALVGVEPTRFYPLDFAGHYGFHRIEANFDFGVWTISSPYACAVRWVVYSLYAFISNNCC